MSVADIFKNIPKAFFSKEIDSSESKFSVYFLLLSLFVCVRSALVIGFRYKKPDFIANVEYTYAFLSFFWFFSINLFSAFFIKFLSHKKDTPYKEILTVLVFGKIRAPMFILGTALMEEYTFLLFFVYSIIFGIYVYNNLKQGNTSKVLFWFLIIHLSISAYADMFDFESELVKYNGIYMRKSGLLKIFK